MSNAPRTLRGITREVFSRGYLRRARARARRRKSPWNAVLVPLGLGAVGGTTYGLFRAMWWLHTVIYPAHAGKLGEFWGRGIGFGAFVSSFLLVIPLFIAAIPIGMMLANLVVWMIPPARRAFTEEAQGVEGASFGEAMPELFTLARFIVPVCLLLSLLGAATLRSLR